MVWIEDSLQDISLIPKDEESILLSNNYFDRLNGYFAYTVNFNSSVKVFQFFFRATTCFEWKVNSNSGSAPSPNQSYFKYEK